MTGWPAQFARNAARLLPDFHPEFGPVAFLVAAAATVGWFFLVHWRISRHPAVLWRAVVLSSGGLILFWVLLMTLMLPSLNYGKSYRAVAQQIATHLPAGRRLHHHQCRTGPARLLRLFRRPRFCGPAAQAVRAALAAGQRAPDR